MSVSKIKANIISWNVCRICLQNGELKSIFENVKESESTYRELIELCAGIQIKTKVNLPELICRKCIAYLNIAYKFRVLCRSSNTTLESFLKSNVVDNELKASFEAVNRNCSPSPKKALSTYKTRKSSISPAKHRSPSPVADHRSSSPDCSTQNSVDTEDYHSENPHTSKPTLRKRPYSNYRKIIVDFKKPSRLEGTNKIENVQHNLEKTENTRNGTDWLDMCSTLNLDENEYFLNNKPRKQKPQKSKKKSHGEMCDICGSIVTGRKALENHIRRHAETRKYTCEICGRCFATNSSQLTRHMRTHTGQKPYSCKYCDRKFSDAGSRTKHLRTHTGEKPFQCQTCGKTFAYSHVLTKHQLVHTGIKDFECLPCGKKFGTAHHLKDHYKTLKHKFNTKEADTKSTQIVTKIEDEHKSSDQIYQEMINDLIIQTD